MPTTGGNIMTKATAQKNMTMEDQKHKYQMMANAIRALSMDAVQKANSGHPGMPMGMADVATVLFSEFLKFDPKNPAWPDRDRFVLSAGHGSMLQYAVMYLAGYEDITLDEIKNFRQLHARTAGHPEYGYAAGIETTTGPLGQGVANAVGMAMAEKMLAARYDDLVDHYTYVIAGDGCLMEGISQEAISMAGHLKLSKLILLFDDNHISIDGDTDLSTSEDQAKRFEACGWDVQKIDGHDVDAVRAAIAQAQTTNTPSMIACRTIIGYGAPTKAGTAGSHGSPLGDGEIAGAREKLGWSYPPFEIPDAVLQDWRAAGSRGAALYKAWDETLNSSAHKTEFNRVSKGELPGAWKKALQTYIDGLVAEKPKLATRASSGNVLEVLTKEIPELIGGSADLTGSNNTKTSCQPDITSDDFSGRYVRYGVREHAMASAMNGMALHKGVIPYAGTFFVFTDYCRPAIRLSALMHQRVIYVMTHDSIGLGEDGPTHQPVEHLASLRAMPNVQLLRPADAVETAEAWQLALEAQDKPTILVLTRQGVPALRTTAQKENLCAKGGYVISDCDGDRQATIISSGSEVHLAVAAQKKLKDQNINAAVVSMVSWDLFDQQPVSYRQQVLGAVPRVAIEAAGGFGWEKYLGDGGAFIGMQGFGASAPASDLYTHFGITDDAVVSKVQELLA